jgi:hypothetical protein
MMIKWFIPLAAIDFIFSDLTRRVFDQAEPNPKVGGI